ncbi:related to ATP-dependent RNA helicase SUV3, mitochondrial precursor [Phialocephala subalpina]|uniref:RNA helicase n=1 Tax=Phialocephala subalpina TaxID=576137 RepID=A0A1L7XE50_9HELO|nr:related to ATP-dependent RNA helicase SUV3, mitochondrial precursor [Phialocephala subalpina]
MSFPAREGKRCLLCTFNTSPCLTFSTPVNGARSFTYAAQKVHRSPRRERNDDEERSQVRGGQRWPAHARLGRHERFGRNVDRASQIDRSGDRTWSPGIQRAPRFDKVRYGAISADPTEIRMGTKRILARNDTTYGVFGRLMLEELDRLSKNLKRKANTEYTAWGIPSKEALQVRLDEFEDQIESCTRLAETGKANKEGNPLFSRFRRAFVVGGVKSLGAEVKFAFINYVVEAKFSAQDKTNQEKLADLRYPFEWFPATRALQRTIHLHVGPTNSGKTYHALKRLEAANTGIYAGPLRLLAHEVYSRFNAKGKSCMLVTGEERRMPEDGSANMSSCTVEMMPLNKRVDVAVIDEIQMMGDAERGWAWTQGLLGVQADEVHVCGELRTIQLVTDLCKAMGDKIVVHKYERLSPLAAEKRSLGGDLTKLRKGDAVILFSRVGIHAMKADIERVTGKRCAVVYGSLPPETRAQQAELFNNPDNEYDFLVASDAVGMGLNLGIKRIVFESVSKHDGISFRVIQPSEIKQIAGRAGRYKTAHQAVNKSAESVVDEDSKEEGGLPLIEKRDSTNGLVTTLERFDLAVVQKAMNLDVEPIKTAGIAPPSDVLFRFASYFPKGTAFSYITQRLYEMSKLSDIFHMCRLKEQTQVADLIEPYPLSTMDRITFMAAPVALREFGFGRIVQEFAECVATQSGGELLDLKTLDLELIDVHRDEFPFGNKAYLRQMENLHKALTLYLWLSYRFAGVFRSQALAFHVKSLAENRIDECLADVHYDAAKRRQLNFLRMKAMELEIAEQEAQREAQDGLDSEESAQDEEAADDGSEGISALEAEVADVVEVNDELADLDEQEQSPASEANVPIPPEERAESESVRA